MDNARQISQGGEGISNDWLSSSALMLYRMDAEEYLGMKIHEMSEIAMKYDASDIKDCDNIIEYYGSRGEEQLARQVLFHHTPPMIQEMEFFHGMVNTQAPGRGADIGCGSAPVTFHFAMKGHYIDFIDIDGAKAYEFTKWRAKKRGVDCGYTLSGQYDYIFMLDSLEHIEDWKSVLNDVAKHLRDGGAFITNYFRNNDYANPEHISMDKPAVTLHLKELGLYPLNDFLWVKRDLGFMDKPKEAA
jgi:SAM-dependent methyltransferase